VAAAAAERLPDELMLMLFLVIDIHSFILKRTPMDASGLIVDGWMDAGI